MDPIIAGRFAELSKGDVGASPRCDVECFELAGPFGTLTRPKRGLVQPGLDDYGTELELDSNLRGFHPLLLMKMMDLAEGRVIDHCPRH
jgi:hypothetical protein